MTISLTAKNPTPNGVPSRFWFIFLQVSYHANLVRSAPPADNNSVIIARMTVLAWMCSRPLPQHHRNHHKCGCHQGSTRAAKNGLLCLGSIKEHCSSTG